jgi:hypothetical protein
MLRLWTNSVKCVNNTNIDMQFVPFTVSPFFWSAAVKIQYAYNDSKSVIVNTLFYGAYKIISTPYYMEIYYNTIRYNTIQCNTFSLPQTAFIPEALHKFLVSSCKTVLLSWEHKVLLNKCNIQCRTQANYIIPVATVYLSDKVWKFRWNRHEALIWEMRNTYIASVGKTYVDEQHGK